MQLSEQDQHAIVRAVADKILPHVTKFIDGTGDLRSWAVVSLQTTAALKEVAPGLSFFDSALLAMYAFSAAAEQTEKMQLLVADAASDEVN